MIEVERPEFLWQYIPAYAEIFAGAKRRQGHEICGLGDEARLLLAVSAVMDQKRSVLYIAESEERAKLIRKGARRFLSGDEVGFYPAKDLLPYESMAGNDRQKIDRIRVAEGLLSEKPFFAVISKNTLSRRMIPPVDWKRCRIFLSVGNVLDIATLTRRLVDMGYTGDTLTEEAGTFSVRGSIVDIFPPAAVHPYRIDFFDDEIESIRVFDQESQISLREAGEVVIGPGASFFLPENRREAGLKRLQTETEEMAGKLKGEAKKRCLDRRLRLLDYLAEGALPDVTEQLLPYFYEEAYLEDYLDRDGLVIVDEAARIQEGLREDDEELANIYKELYLEGDILPSYTDHFRSAAQSFAALNRRSLLSFSFLRTPTGLDTKTVDSLAIREFSFFRMKAERGEELRELTGKGKLFFCAAEESGIEKMRGIAKTWELRDCRVVCFPLEKSLEIYDVPAYFIAERDLLGYVNPGEKKRKQKAKPISSFVDLKAGDYVVHETHGIGQYLGIERLMVGGVESDYLQIRYEGKDKLYIPTNQMDLLQKYIGGGDYAPKLNRLGGKEWKNTKEKVRGAVREMAGDLLRLYAAREQEKGYAFSADNDWLMEMEADFPYEETPDQIEAIEDVKKDMEKPRPMDRLLCGDVGYGKTEVSLRAAFKAVLDGKQVAVLVPTTILAQQHERTFKERLEKFGVRIGVLSRFKPKKEIETVLTRLAVGEVDIVIGTHMLFNRRVKYRDLGLLVIDEEQRFGVAHKEKIKKLKKNVDVLAMSATPIPRTLHMSLLGVRDISIIETPPQFRQPVKTYVMEYQSRLIKEAIEREISRGGQVYCIHNRVEDITATAAGLRELVPGVEIIIGHGQMAERQLEKVMLDFMQHEADVLLCTTIVESGLDFPNVNTLIVDGADRFGLSQMYQLRGRVGRSRQQAYAYFFYPKGKLLNVSAQKRLAAVKEHTDLGSGFKIAMRDLEIRGAGNILGAEQHGHMASVGFDMYCRLIDEEVRRLNGQTVAKEKEEVAIDVLCSAYLPEDYVGDGDIKIAVYKKIAEINSEEEMKEYLNELEDRFGSVPDPVYHLFLVIRLKLLAERLGIVAVSQKKNAFSLVFDGLNNVGSESISRLVQTFGRRFAFAMNDHLEMKVKTEPLSPEKALLYMIKILVFLTKEA
jgi:transcription-repair coupling factor (superfamily II helicase)